MYCGNCGEKLAFRIDGDRTDGELRHPNGDVSCGTCRNCGRGMSLDRSCLPCDNCGSRGTKIVKRGYPDLPPGGMVHLFETPVMVGVVGL